MRVVIAGSSGLLGTALRESYQRDGHTVVRLARNELGAIDPTRLAGADAIVNFAGAGIGEHRWSRRYRAEIRRSRIETAAALAHAAARASPPPGLLLSASGIRFYGIDRGDEVLTEASKPAADGLLATVAQAWEQATQPAEAAGIRVVHLRLGLVLSGRGGVLPPMLRPFRLGVGLRFSAGREYWSVVSLRDTVRALRFLTDLPGAAGPYNITGPHPVRQAELMRTLAALTGTRLLVPVPRPALRLALGGIADEVFGGLLVLPARLVEAGFTFVDQSAESACMSALGEFGS